jgi:hypothetical protein
MNDSRHLQQMPDEAERPLEGVQRVLIYAGAGGSLLLVLIAIGRVFSRVGSTTSRQSELIPIAVGWILITGWVLSPYLGALKMERQPSATRARETILIVALVLMIALEVNSFLATSAFVGGRPHPTADSMTIVFIPLLQWVILGVASLLRRIAHRISRE